MAGAVAGCAPPPRTSTAAASVEHRPARGFPPYLDARWSSFRDHVFAAPDSLAGIDYGPVAAETFVCPTAAGVVIATMDAHGMSGMVVTVAHGLGWKTIYGHLDARFVASGEQVRRREVIGVMGASGWGASRSGVSRHLHVSLWGPEWSDDFAGVPVQRWPRDERGFRHVLDPEAFSLAPGGYLPYARAEDAVLDEAFLALHADAVRVADDLLARFDDPPAVSARTRTRTERESGFDVDVDQRIQFLVERLERGPHPFAPDEARDHLATLRAFTRATPRLTAPVVEPRRRADYHVRRAAPLKTYDARGF